MTLFSVYMSWFSRFLCFYLCHVLCFCLCLCLSCTLDTILIINTNKLFCREEIDGLLCIPVDLDSSYVPTFRPGNVYILNDTLWMCVNSVGTVFYICICSDMHWRAGWCGITFAVWMGFKLDSFRQGTVWPVFDIVIPSFWWSCRFSWVLSLPGYLRYFV